MRSTFIAVLTAGVVGVQADYTLKTNPTAPAAISWQASQYLGNPAYHTAEDDVRSAAAAYYQTASRLTVPEAVLKSAVPSDEWNLFSSVRAIQNSLNEGGSVAVTATATDSASSSASATSGSGIATASPSATSSVSGSSGNSTSANSTTGAGGTSGSARSATTSSQSAGAAKATGMVMGAVLGAMAVLAV